MIDHRINPLPYYTWGLYNWGRPLGVYRLKQDAVAAAMKISGKSWKECSAYFEIHKVRVEKHDGSRLKRHIKDTRGSASNPATEPQP